MKKLITFVGIFIIPAFCLFYYYSNTNKNFGFQSSSLKLIEGKLAQMRFTPEINPKKSLKIEKLVIKRDKDKDGIYDLEDIVQGARKDAKNKPKYISKYYRGGYPPKNEGVCSDVVWRAFKNAGYNIKALIDKDIRKYRKDYPEIKKPDSNIDFRRVKNLYVFFKKYSKNLTTQLIPNNVKNLKEWQGGDIVTFDEPSHIAIVSDKRNSQGVPYLIHNWLDHTRETDDFQLWYISITGHFRYPK